MASGGCALAAGAQSPSSAAGIAASLQARHSINFPLVDCTLLIARDGIILSQISTAERAALKGGSYRSRGASQQAGSVRKERLIGELRLRGGEGKDVGSADPADPMLRSR